MAFSILCIDILSRPLLLSLYHIPKVSGDSTNCVIRRKSEGNCESDGLVGEDGAGGQECGGEEITFL